MQMPIMPLSVFLCGFPTVGGVFHPVATGPERGEGGGRKEPRLDLPAASHGTLHMVQYSTCRFTWYAPHGTMQHLPFHMVRSTWYSTAPAASHGTLHNNTFHWGLD